jgi:hypothetical protein
MKEILVVYCGIQELLVGLLRNKIINKRIMTSHSIKFILEHNNEYIC